MLLGIGTIVGTGVALDEIAALANAGTLAAFTAVCASLLVLRVRETVRTRVFRAPMARVIGPLGIAGCIHLLFSLPVNTQVWLLIWNVGSLVVYFACLAWNSRLAKGEEVEG
jgi:APA family basic amino acid/polyamine antiporter